MLKVKSASAIKYYHLCKEDKKKVEEKGKIVLKDLCKKCRKKYWVIVKRKKGPKNTRKSGYTRLTDVAAKEKVNGAMLKLRENLVNERAAHMGRVDGLKKETKAIDKEIKKHINMVDDIDIQVKRLDSYLDMGKK
jgi:hypothetical protein